MQAPKDLLRFVTMGSVDDGKSTLIGRLLVDSGSLYEDHLGQLRRLRRAGDELEYGLALDGLHAEREQGITIDVAYRYFSTQRRRFIIADCPGHTQYTRNMATGASSADVAVLLLDVRSGVVEQARRHAYISALLGVEQVIVAVNKMDLVDYSRDAFDAVRRELAAVSADLGLAHLAFVPVSALRGDNVFDPSERMPWYDGPTILQQLETAHVARDHAHAALRFPVQRAVRTSAGFRGYAGTVAAGTLRRGAEVVVLPGRRRTRIAKIVTFDGDLDCAHAGMAVTVTLDDAVDVSRGDMLCELEGLPCITTKLDATLIWLDSNALSPEQPYVVKHTTRRVRGVVAQVHHRIDLETLRPEPAASLTLNAIGRVSLDLGSPLVVDPYAVCRETGSFIIIDPRTHRTVAAGIVTGEAPAAATRPDAPEARGPRPLWLCGPDGAALSPERAHNIGSVIAGIARAADRVVFVVVDANTGGAVSPSNVSRLAVPDNASAADIARALTRALDADDDNDEREDAP